MWTWSSGAPQVPVPQSTQETRRDALSPAGSSGCWGFSPPEVAPDFRSSEELQAVAKVGLLGASRPRTHPRTRVSASSAWESWETRVNAAKPRCRRAAPAGSGGEWTGRNQLSDRRPWLGGGGAVNVSRRYSGFLCWGVGGPDRN